MESKGVGHDFSNEKYNDFSNKMAEYLLDEISTTGNVSHQGIINTDAESFTQFAPNLIQKSDWPGALIDNAILGGDIVDANFTNISGAMIAALITNQDTNVMFPDMLPMPNPSNNQQDESGRSSKPQSNNRYPSQLPGRGWYDNGHQCVAPWAKDLLPNRISIRLRRQRHSNHCRIRLFRQPF